MEETLSNSRFITYHRNQVNPQADPPSTLTFAYGTSKYSKSHNAYTNNLLTLITVMSQTKS